MFKKIALHGSTAFTALTLSAAPLERAAASQWCRADDFGNVSSSYLSHNTVCFMQYAWVAVAYKVKTMVVPAPEHGLSVSHLSWSQ